ncbi:hypothetical protein E2C01_025018 [Portunus trituberculatus]|uniref:Uncharacterized protein n=1 Tax=Portunus trituberculatus TaxID=210409 RepID=A0A5B7EC75_PORTR|nr:hypothetical protein [Portunus trituberculatus]
MGGREGAGWEDGGEKGSFYSITTFTYHTAILRSHGLMHTRLAKSSQGSVCCVGDQGAALTSPCLIFPPLNPSWHLENDRPTKTLMVGTNTQQIENTIRFVSMYTS